MTVPRKPWGSSMGVKGYVVVSGGFIKASMIAERMCVRFLNLGIVT